MLIGETETNQQSLFISLISMISLIIMQSLNQLYMASITIRNLDDKLKSKLRVQAAEHGRSMEEEVRTILKEALAKKTNHSQNLADSMHELFEPLGGIDLPEFPRESIREPIDFGSDS